jgi:CRISPR-associated protein Csd1
MIIKALSDFYDKHKTQLPSSGFVKQKLSFILVIDGNGNFLGVEDTKENGKSRDFYVPSLVKITGGSTKANLFYDVAERALGVTDDKKKEKKVKEAHKNFKERIKSFAGKHLSVDSLIKFLDQLTFVEAKKIMGGNRISPGDWISFKIDSNNNVIIDEIKNLLSNTGGSSSNSNQAFCPIAESVQEIATLHPSIRQSDLISFNENAFCSYKLESGLNAGISSQSAEKYTKALSYLMEENSITNGKDNIIVFWSSDVSFDTKTILSFFKITNFSSNPSMGVSGVKSLFQSHWRGSAPSPNQEDRFYILDLTRNMKRWSIQVFKEDTLANIGENLCKHFEDLQIEDNGISISYALFPLLNTLKVSVKDDIPQHIIRDIIDAIFFGTTYPEFLLYSLLSRIRSQKFATNRADEQKRAALLKAVLNRRNRDKNNWRKIQMSLDKENKNIGYLLGRLLAVLEKLQEEANGSSNIRNSWGAYSSSPSTMVNSFLKNSTYHLNKLQKGKRIFFDKLIGEIMENIRDNIPNSLSIDNQAILGIGYYHQKNSFYKKNKGEQPNEQV